MNLKKAALWAVVLFLVVAVSAATLATVGFVVMNESGDSASSSQNTSGLEERPENATPVMPSQEEKEPPLKRHPNDPGSTSVTAESRHGTQVVNSSLVEEHLYKEVNEYRQNRSLSNMTSNQRLASVGRAYSRTMSEKKFFDHTPPDDPYTEGPERWDKVSNECHEGLFENLAYWSITEQEVGAVEVTEPNKTVEESIAEAVVQTWHHSNEGHRETLTSKRTEYLGVGVYIATETPASSRLIEGNESSPKHISIFVTYLSCHGENPDWDYAENKTKVTEGYGENQTETSNPSDSSKSGSLSVWSP